MAARPPDVVCLGFPKCATTWLWESLSRHKMFGGNKLQKEVPDLLFGNQPVWERSKAVVDKYYSRFDVPGLAADFAPGYSVIPLATQHIVDVAPDAQYIVVLRDPITRAESHAAQINATRFKRLKIPERERTLFDSTVLHPEIINSSRYDMHLCEILRCVPHRQLLVLQQEKILAEPKRQLEKVAGFIGLPSCPNPVPGRVNKRKPRGVKISAAGRKRLADFFAPVVVRTQELLANSPVTYDIDWSLWQVQGP